MSEHCQNCESMSRELENLKTQAVIMRGTLESMAEEDDDGLNGAYETIHGRSMGRPRSIEGRDEPRQRRKREGGQTVIVTNPIKDYMLCMSEEEAQVMLSALFSWSGLWPNETNLSPQDKELQEKRLALARAMHESLGHEIEARYYAEQAYFENLETRTARRAMMLINKLRGDYTLTQRAKNHPARHSVADIRTDCRRGTTGPRHSPAA